MTNELSVFGCLLRRQQPAHPRHVSNHLPDHALAACRSILERLSLYPNLRTSGTIAANRQYDSANLDKIVKSQKLAFHVIPAKAGIQYFQLVLDPDLRRGDG